MDEGFQKTHERNTSNKNELLPVTMLDALLENEDVEKNPASPRTWRHRKRQALLLLLIGWVVLGLGLSALTFSLLYKSAHTSKTQEFRLKCNNRVEVLRAEWISNLQAAGVFTGLVKAFPNASQADFLAFADATLFTRPNVARVVWLERVLPSERAAYEQRHGAPISTIGHNLTLTPRDQDYEYAPVSRVTRDGLWVINGDPMSLPTLRQAIERARDYGEYALSGSEVFNEVLKMTSYFPVYADNFDPVNKTIEERRQACSGYIGAVFWVRNMFEAAMMRFGHDDQIAMSSWDITNNDSIPCSGATIGDRHVGLGDYKVAFPLGGRRFELHCKDLSNKQLESFRIAIAWAGMVAVIVLLSAVIVLLTLKRMQAVEKDVEKMKTLNVELEEAKQAAQAADRAKGRFIATMSHEIRTPLSGVIGMTNLLMDTRLDANQLDLCRTAQASGNTLVALVNDVLDFSKIEAGHMEIESLAFDVRAELETVLGLFADRVRQKGLELVALVHKSVPQTLVGDPGRLLQVINNLVSNAVKFTKTGSVFICVSLGDPAGLVDNDPEKAKEAFANGGDPPVDWVKAGPGGGLGSDGPYVSMRPGSTCCNEAAVERFVLEGKSGLHASEKSGTVRLVISVEDTGIGIPKSVQPRLFRPFLQADSSTSRQYGGTGIGLSIVGRLVALMGGRMRVHSTPDIGSTFHFDLRLSLPPPQSQSELRDRGAWKKKSPLPGLAGARVAVIGPNAVRREVVAQYLSQLGLVPESLACSTAFEKLEGAAEAGTPFPLAVLQVEPSLMECVGAFMQTVTVDKAHLGAATTLVAFALDQANEAELLRMGFKSVLLPPLRQSAMLSAIAAACQLTLKRSSSSGPSKDDWLQGKTILVVDDALINRKVVSRMLERHGCKTVCVPSGQGALDVMRATSTGNAAPGQAWVDLVLMDVQMPEMDGYETVRQLRRWEAECCESAHPGRDSSVMACPSGCSGQSGGQCVEEQGGLGQQELQHLGDLRAHRCRVPIVALTADVMLGTREKCTAAGMDDYASKPLNPKRLYDILEKYLGQREAEVP